jgi:hypothetical protein
MKRTYLLIAALFTATLGFAQDAEPEVLRSRRGHVILPQAGDFSLGFNAVPVVNFALNAVNIASPTGGTAQHPGYIPGMNQIIVGKYFLSDNTALRLRVGINASSEATTFFGDDPLAEVDAEDVDEVRLATQRTNTNRSFIGAGLEFRRGHNRLQGYYGGELLVGFGGGSTTFNYAYSLEQLNNAPDPAVAQDERTLALRDGTFLALGLRGFVGVEYFVAPKISIGAEFGLGLGVNRGGRGSIQSELWEDDNRVTERVRGNQREHGRGVWVDPGIGFIGQTLNPTAALMIHFHF